MFILSDLCDVDKCKQSFLYDKMIKSLAMLFHMENIVDVSKIHVEKQYLACDIWTTLSALACFGESTTPSQHTSLRMDSASIQITSKSISEQDCISIFKISHKKHWLELPKVDMGLEPLFPLSL